MYGGYAQWGGGVYAGDTWEWDGVSWTKKASSDSGPGDREYTLLAYDPVVKKTVMLGGWGNTPELFNSETWLWDGVSWTKANPQHAPQPRIGSSMIYFPGDAQTRGIYLFGGDVLHEEGNPSSRYNDNDMWRWDGADWQKIEPSNTPPSARWGHSLSFFPRSGSDSIALFGGNGPGASDELWFFNPSTLAWEQATKSGSWPEARSQTSLVHDPVSGKLIMYGGWNYYYYNDTWEYGSASGWTPINTAGPYSRAAHSMVMTAAGGLLFGGVTNGQVFDDTFKYTASTWTKTYRPRIDAYGRAVYDTLGETNVLLGMSSSTNPAVETWKGNASALSLEPQNGPESRYFHQVAYDTKRHRTVLFGGHSNPQTGSGVAIDDTWEFDGGTWENKNPAHRPLARWWSAMSYDAAREVVVLYGGVDTNQVVLGDTWEWNGIDWQQRFPVHTPGPSLFHAMAYDAALGHVILHGGKPSQSGSTSALTWSWDGADWIVINEDAANARYGHELVFDSTRNILFAFGGYRQSGWNSDIGEFNGNSWTQIVKQDGQVWPANRAFFPLTYDAKRKAVALLGGDTNGAESTNTFWEYTIADSDLDGTADCVDFCPNDFLKISAGVCGCGVSDADSDGDGVANCNDACSADAGKAAPGICGCGIADIDGDSDGTATCHDQCPSDPLKVSPGICGCGAPDADGDLDGTYDCQDSCVSDPLKINAGICGCGASDIDTDGEGTADCLESCPNDKLKLAPGICGCGVTDADNNGNGTADCLDPNVSSLTPKKLSVKQKGKVVTLTAAKQAGMEYVFQYATATKVGKKWKEGRSKLVRSKVPTLTLKTLKKRQYYNFSVKYVLARTAAAISRSSATVRYQVK